MYQVIKNYRDNEKLRHSFNELAKKTFAIDFEDWYQNGYWTDRYNPYSIAVDGKVVANVSVNTTGFEIRGENTVCGTWFYAEKRADRAALLRQIKHLPEQSCLFGAFPARAVFSRYFIGNYVRW